MVPVLAPPRPPQTHPSMDKYFKIGFTNFPFFSSLDKRHLISKITAQNLNIHVYEMLEVDCT